jgi:hypothetical protein
MLTTINNNTILILNFLVTKLSCNLGLLQYRDFSLAPSDCEGFTRERR